MPIQVVLESDINLEQLITAKNDGYQVEETPHVGNLAMSTMALMSLDFKAKLVDITIGNKDNLFYPHCNIVNGHATVIACAEKMTTHNKTYQEEIPLANYHSRPLKQLGLPAVNHSEWVAERNEVACEIIKTVTTSHTLSIWNRFVESDGTVINKSVADVSALFDSVHKVTTGSQESGWVVPNPINILLDLVIGAMETNKDVVYMLSGQSMYRYIFKGYHNFGSMSILLSAMYDSVRAKLNLQLPQNLVVKMVPTTVLRHFVAPMGYQNVLDRKLKSFQSLMQGKKRCGIKFSQGLLSKSTMEHIRSKRQNLLLQLTPPLKQFCAESETGSFFTQHDLVLQSEKIYIPNQVMTMPIKSMIESLQTMNRLIQKGRV